MKSSRGIYFNVRCEACGSRKLWGFHEAVRALVAAGALSPRSEFDAPLFAELFLVHSSKILCPDCRTIGKLTAARFVPDDWEWEDAIRCEDCGEEIPESRRQAVPQATRCIACQRQFEQQRLHSK